MIREVGFRKADDFYVALGQGKISSKTVDDGLGALGVGGLRAAEAELTRIPGPPQPRRNVHLTPPGP